MCVGGLARSGFDQQKNPGGHRLITNQEIGGESELGAASPVRHPSDSKEAEKCRGMRASGGPWWRRPGGQLAWAAERRPVLMLINQTKQPPRQEAGAERQSRARWPGTLPEKLKDKGGRVILALLWFGGVRLPTRRALPQN